GRLADRQMTLEVTPAARHLIATAGFDPIYGARPLRRFIAHEVETRIGRALLGGEIHDGAVIRVELAEGELTVTWEMSWCVRSADARTVCPLPRAACLVAATATRLSPGSQTPTTRVLRRSSS